MTKMTAMYTVIRYVPNILKGEFVNVGVILVCPEYTYQGLRSLPSFGVGSKAKLLEGSDGLFVRHAVNKLQELLELNRAADLVGEEGVTANLLNFTGLEILHKMYNNNIQLSKPYSAATDNPEELLEKLYQDFVGTAVTVYDPYQKAESTVEPHWKLEKELKAGIDTQIGVQFSETQFVGPRQFRLVYQPMYSFQTGALIKTEALLRWEHPRLGFISPTEFIPIAEESGLIIPLGTWVLEEACRQAKAWQARHQDVHICVNISPLQFSHSDFYLTVVNALKGSGLSGGYLELELTESMLMNQPSHVKQVLSDLQDLGVRIAIDDFGTGYSSLNYLRDLPIDTIKIDRSFVLGLTEGDRETAFSKALVEAIIELAKYLELEVVAEGVETEAQYNLLKQLGCSVGQGYFFAKPMKAEEFYSQKLPKHLTVTVVHMS
jgi:EAL domain-containing protein (putative c-di-GMP-specific phosphodiesterase class I)